MSMLKHSILKNKYIILKNKGTHFCTYMLVLAVVVSQMFLQFLLFPRIRGFHLSYSKA